MTAGQLLNAAIERLRKNACDEPEANAQWLLADAMGKKRLELLAALQCDVSREALAKFEQYLQKKEQGQPLAYILGTQDFIDITLKVDTRVLIPRPETEELAELAASFLYKYMSDRKQKEENSNINALDYGCGSGAIGFWLLTKFPEMKLIAVDKSLEALECARENAENLGIFKHIDFKNISNPAQINGQFDIIVSNPPYIPSEIIPGLSPEVLNEPHMALDGGHDGLSIARMVLLEAGRLLLPGGGLFMELSGGDPERLATEAKPGVWSKIESVNDFSGQSRFFVAVKT